MQVRGHYVLAPLPMEQPLDICHLLSLLQSDNVTGFSLLYFRLSWRRFIWLKSDNERIH